MAYAQLINGTPIELNGRDDVNFNREVTIPSEIEGGKPQIVIQACTQSFATIMLWSDEERADIGVYEIVDDIIPNDKVPTGSTLSFNDDVVVRTYTLINRPATPIPTSITPAQAKATLYDLDLLDDAEALVEAHPYALVRIYWNSALQFDRSNAYINALAFELGLDDDDLDELFTTAAARIF